MLITDKNVKQTFSNNSGYSIEENQTRETNHYQDIFTPSAIKALNQTQIKQLWKVYSTWEEVFSHIKDKNFDYIYTAAEIDELIEIIRIKSENLFKDIAAYVEDRLDKYKKELSQDGELINNIATKLVDNEDLVNKFEEKLQIKFTEKLNELEIKQNELEIKFTEKLNLLSKTLLNPKTVLLSDQFWKDRLKNERPLNSLIIMYGIYINDNGKVLKVNGQSTITSFTIINERVKLKI